MTDDQINLIIKALYCVNVFDYGVSTVIPEQNETLFLVQTMNDNKNVVEK